MSGTAVFLDPSIVIARCFHGPELKKRIEKRLAEFNIICTGLVVKCEFKRRVLKEALYLLQLLRRLGSFKKVQRHVTDYLPQPQARKKQICLDMLETISESDTDADYTDRAACFLEYLLENGLDDFDDDVDHVFQESQCACGLEPVRLDEKGRYGFGATKCAETEDRCGIAAFLSDCAENIRVIHGSLQEITDGRGKKKPSDETVKIYSFISDFMKDPSDIKKKDPCTVVVDLMIALESRKVPTFYTMNGKESQFLCRAISQDLIVRPNYHIHEDIVCRQDDPEWRDF